MSEKVKFRELIITDTVKLYEIYSDKEAMKYRGSKAMRTIEEAENFIKNKSLKKMEILTIRKAIELMQTKELIGSAMYRFDENKKYECEIGYSIGRQFWGQGLGKEIVKMMVKAIEEKNEINKIVAWSNKDNLASIKILEKIGFKRISQTLHPDSFLYHKTRNKS